MVMCFMQKQLVLVDILCRIATVFQATDDEKRYGHFQKKKNLQLYNEQNIWRNIHSRGLWPLSSPDIFFLISHFICNLYNNSTINKYFGK
jgi:hypothetical protein